MEDARWLDDVEQRLQSPTPNEPVLCGGCLHYQRQVVDITGRVRHRCWHPHAKEAVVTFAEQRVRWHDADARNVHNDCPDFAPWRLTQESLGRDYPVVMCLLIVGGFVAVVYGIAHAVFAVSRAFGWMP